MQTNGDGNVKNVIYSIYGKTVAQACLEVDYEYEGIHITGAIGKPEIARSNRGNQIFFVNKRYVRDKVLSNSAEKAYKGMIPIGKFGFIILNLDMPPADVDVNVHPAKLEVRFKEEQKVFKALYHGIQDTLLKAELVASTETPITGKFEKNNYEGEIMEEEQKSTISGLFRKIAKNADEYDNDNLIESIYRSKNGDKDALEEAGFGVKPQTSFREENNNSAMVEKGPNSIANYEDNSGLPTNAQPQNSFSQNNFAASSREQETTNTFSTNQTNISETSKDDVIKNTVNEFVQMGKNLTAEQIREKIAKIAAENAARKTQNIESSYGRPNEKVNEYDVPKKEENNFDQYGIPNKEENSFNQYGIPKKEETSFDQYSIPKEERQNNDYDISKQENSNQYDLQNQDNVEQYSENKGTNTNNFDDTTNDAIARGVYQPSTSPSDWSSLYTLTNNTGNNSKVEEPKSNYDSSYSTNYDTNTNTEEQKPGDVLLSVLQSREEEIPSVPKGQFDDMYAQIFGNNNGANAEEGNEKTDQTDANDIVNNNMNIFETSEQFEGQIPHKLLGIAFQTYIILEIKDELYILDQHAAHERIMYEKVKQNYYSDTDKDSQLMLLPDIITLTHKEMDIARENMDKFEKAGFVLEEFGDNTIKLTGVPNICLDLDTKELFLETLDEINTVARTAKQEIEEKFIATIACKAAVKANMALTNEEVESLLNELLKLPNPFTCPHGRPTAIKLSKMDIEKKFARRK